MFNAPRKLSTQLSFDIMLMAVPIFILSLGMLFKQSGILVHQKVEECSHSILNTEVQRVRVFMGTIETAANSNVWMLEENFRPDSLQSVSNRIVRLNTPVRYLSCLICSRSTAMVSRYIPSIRAAR